LLVPKALSVSRRHVSVATIVDLYRLRNRLGLLFTRIKDATSVKRCVPQPYRVVPAGGGEGFAVGAERHVRDLVGVAGEGGDGLAGGYISQP
jgi:hypothetical protein